ncbi:MAG: hypothetical protein ABSG85_12870 [Spirochaetia bacterium]|jgi:hypothetical protein
MNDDPYIMVLTPMAKPPDALFFEPTLKGVFQVFGMICHVSEIRGNYKSFVISIALGDLNFSAEESIDPRGDDWEECIEDAIARTLSGRDAVIREGNRDYFWTSDQREVTRCLGDAQRVGDLMLIRMDMEFLFVSDASDPIVLDQLLN